MVRAILVALVLLSGTARADKTWVTSVAQASRDSVVRIDCGGGMGSGFVFHTSRHVGTAFHVIASGRPITLRFTDGSTRPAKVKAIDREHDLAILEIGGADIKQQPLALDTEVAQIGSDVMAIGHPFAPLLPVSGKERDAWKGLLEWTVTTGIVSAVSPTRIQTDTVVHPGNSGGPLIASSGRVVGVVSAGVAKGPGLNFAIRADHLAHLTTKLATPLIFRGDWDGGLLLSPLVAHVEGRGATLADFPSVGIDFELVGRDRYTILIGGGAVRTDEAFVDGLFSRNVRRTFFEASLGYRKVLIYRQRTRAVVFAFAVGGLLTRDKTTQRQLELGQVDPTCDPATTSCEVDAAGPETKSIRWNFRPTGTAWFSWSGVRFSYTIAIDPTDASDRTQSFSLGLRL